MMGAKSCAAEDSDRAKARLGTVATLPQSIRLYRPHSAPCRCTHCRCKGPQRAAILSRQAKVTDLQLPCVAVQQVAGLEVTVNHPVVMQVGYALQELLHQALDLRRTAMQRCAVFMQVCVRVWARVLRGEVFDCFWYDFHRGIWHVCGCSYRAPYIYLAVCATYTDRRGGALLSLPPAPTRPSSLISL